VTSQDSRRCRMKPACQRRRARLSNQPGSPDGEVTYLAGDLIGWLRTVATQPPGQADHQHPSFIGPIERSGLPPHVLTSGYMQVTSASAVSCSLASIRTGV
jgi:hypothetical protein